MSPGSTAAPTGALVRRFLELYPGEAAGRLEASDPQHAAELLSSQPASATAEVLRRANADFAARVLESSHDDAAAALLQAFDPARAATLCAQLDADSREHLLSLVPRGLASEIADILEYPPDTAGHLMDARATTLPTDTTVAEALDRIRELPQRRISDVIVIDEDGLFEGVVRLQDIAGAASRLPLRELRRPRAVHVHPMQSREEVVELLNQYNLASLPVVDLQGRVVGIIRYSALVQAAQQNATQDLQQMVGASKEERALSSPWVGVRSRLPWLHVNLLTAFAAAAVVGLFEDTIARFTAVAVLLPVVAGQSGNTGAQALAVTMRGLALREIRVSHAMRVLLKEIAVGSINGLAIAVVTSAGVWFWSGNLGLVLVMFIAMILAMVIASAAGALIPVLLVKLGRDPATASSIILTTVTDIAGFFAFLGLATALADMLAG